MRRLLPPVLAAAALACPRAAVLSEVARTGGTPVQITHCADARTLVVLQEGEVRELTDGVPVFLDMTDVVGVGGESGLLGLACAPTGDGSGDRWAWAFWSSRPGDDVLSRFRVTASGASRASERELFRIYNASVHHGGQLAFAPFDARGRKLLHLSVGERGDRDRAADLLDPRGKILRFEPGFGDDAAAATPDDNPQPGAPGLASLVWASGLRNPWRFGFDADSGDMYIADVGEGRREEIDVARHGAPPGDFGWPRMEGTHCVAACDPTSVPPIHELGDDACAVIGGIVARGGPTPWLRGQFVFGDYCAKDVMALTEVASDRFSVRRIAIAPTGVVGFGEDAAGAVHVGTRDGAVWRIDGPPDPLSLVTSRLEAFGVDDRPPIRLVAAGGSRGPTWSVAAGSLPRDLALGPDGRFDGAPDAFPPASILVRASDGDDELVASTCVVHAGWPVAWQRRVETRAASFTAPEMTVRRVFMEIGVDVVTPGSYSASLDYTRPGTGSPVYDAGASFGFQGAGTRVLASELGSSELLGLPISGRWELEVDNDQTRGFDPFTWWRLIIEARAGACSDEDRDGVPSVSDDCLAFGDAQQLDADVNGFGDACDEVTWGDVAPAGTPDGIVDVADAVWTLRAAVGLEQPTLVQARRADVAPFTILHSVVSPAPGPSPALDVADAVAILRASVGLVSFARPQ